MTQNQTLSGNLPLTGSGRFISILRQSFYASLCRSLLGLHGMVGLDRLRLSRSVPEWPRFRCEIAANEKKPMTYLPALLGGMLIGLAATVLLVANGRVAGISGIVDGLFGRDVARVAVNAVFVVGLLLGPLLFRASFNMWPQVTVTGSLTQLTLAGLLVGFGTRLGSGCTSGHGVVGLARLSPRSIVAVISFLGSAVVTVFAMRQAGLA